MANVFDYRTYKEFLRDLAKQSNERGFQSRLSEAIGCSRPHLSQVLRAKTHLTPDQSYRVTRFLRMGKLEQKYFLAMVDKDRCGDPEFAQYLAAQMEQMRRDAGNLAKRFQMQSMGVKEQSKYYSSWIYGAIHILLTIDKYQKVTELAKKLKISEDILIENLQELEDLGLAKKDGAIWKATNAMVHINRESPFAPINHLNWRLRAVEDSRFPSAEGLHYSSIYSMSNADIIQLRKLMLKFIDDSRDLAIKSKEEDAVCFNCDLFRL